MIVLAVAILVTRCLALVLALALAARTVRGFWALWRGDVWPVGLVRAALFLFAAGCASYQIGYVIEGLPEVPHARILMSAMIIDVALIVALWALHDSSRFDLLRRVWRRIDLALAIVDLACVDPAAAETAAEDCRTATARAIIARGRRA